jgi:hypothetical protein
MVATKKDSQKCTNVVKRIPKEQFRLPSDGDRKWKAVASKRKQTLIEISTYANGDGTFIGQTGIDYSPSIETLMDSASSPRTLYRVLDGLKELKFLDWTRESHYKRRSYTINLPATVPEPGNHLPDSDEKHLPNQGQESETPAKSTVEKANHLPNETKTPAIACTDIRLLPSFKEPSKEEPSEKTPSDSFLRARAKINEQEAETLTDYLISKMLDVDPNANGFSLKVKAEMQRAIKTYCPTKDVLKVIAFDMVGRSDDSKYSSGQAGNLMAGSLGARILAFEDGIVRLKNADKQADRQREALEAERLEDERQREAKRAADGVEAELALADPFAP